MTEWFEQWFGEEYHALYPHRDDDDARRVVALVRRAAPWRDGDRVLDLACGAGRHAAEFERLGARVAGFDLSPAMLRRAHSRTRAALVRGDMARVLEVVRQGLASEDHAAFVRRLQQAAANRT